MAQNSRSLKSTARAVLSRVKRRVMRRAGPTGPYLGHVDELTPDNELRGWIYDTRTRKGFVMIGLYAGNTLLKSEYANAVREDVRAAHDCETNCGFLIPLNDTLYQQIQDNGGTVSVRTIGQDVQEIGSIALPAEVDNPLLSQGGMAACAHALRSHLVALEALLDETPEAPSLPKLEHTAFRQHQIMFADQALIPDMPRSGQPAYMDYVRFRYRVDEDYKVGPGLETADRYLYWYMTTYRAQHKYRVPLSAAHIEYLNEPMVMAGQKYTLSRMLWWRVMGRPDLLGRMNLNDRDQYLDMLFWWAHQDAPHLYYEDCLVPDRFVDQLASVHTSRRLDAYPLSYFTERFYKDTPSLRFLRPGTPEGRKTLVLAMMVMAATRPDLLRYIPTRSLDQLLAPDEEGICEFERFVNGLRTARAEIDTGEESETASTPLSLSRTRFAAALRLKYFDLTAMRFMTRDPEGHRYEAAALPTPAPDQEPVDVQLIGPIAKASGLGQATRLSADILRATGRSVRSVNLNLDNPAPEGFSSDAMIEDTYGNAKINLLHLNAESIPLAFAYQPDVFSNSYNIGYFYWELDQPAFCHYLGMEMLDEIWVSADYGVMIYEKDFKGKPVVNVGMCYEDMPDITRKESRDYVERRFLLDDSHFICLVAFDSFSFVQRKNSISVLKAFQKAFEGVPDARLIVKTQNREDMIDPTQKELWEQVDTIVSADPRIIVMNETQHYDDVLRLKCGADCYISLHRSEGWGFGMLEAMNLGTPVVCTAYSGNMDFCSDDTVWLVDYEEQLLRKGDYIFMRRGSKWAEPNLEHAAAQMRAVYDDPKTRAKKVRAAQAHIRKNFSVEAIAKRYGKRLDELLKTL